MRVLLLILAGISGLLNAYMLGNIDEVNEENKDNFEDTLVFLGRKGLKEQKDFLFSFIDRKSTRLNSSHVSISYAVFCLKKKTGARQIPISIPSPYSAARVLKGSGTFK